MEKVEGFLKNLKLTSAAATYVRKKVQIKVFLNYLFEKGGNYFEATKQDIEGYLLQLPGGTGYKQQTCILIRAFYDYLPVAPNPASEIKFLYSSNKRRLYRIPPVSVMEGIIAFTQEKDAVLDKRNALMLELAYGSGLRRTELVRLDTEDIDQAAHTAYVLGKRNKERIVPVTAAALYALREYLFAGGHVRGPLLRSRTGRRLKPEMITTIFKKKTGLNPHLFRHACATHMLKAGCNIRYIQELLGHDSLESTQIYTHTSKEDLRKVMQETHPMSLQITP
jgi:integrase/recombinase XerC